MQREPDSACTEHELNDLEDPKQQKPTEEQRRAFLTADFRRVSSKLNDPATEQAGAKSNNTAARATVRALDADGDGNSVILRSCPHTL